MKPDQERVRNLLTDTVTLLCKNGLQYNKELRVQGLLGITLDDSDVFVVHINEKFGDLVGGAISLRTDNDDDDTAITTVATSYKIPSHSMNDSDDAANSSPSSSTLRKRATSSIYSWSEKRACRKKHRSVSVKSCKDIFPSWDTGVVALRPNRAVAVKTEIDDVVIIDDKKQLCSTIADANGTVPSNENFYSNNFDAGDDHQNLEPWQKCMADQFISTPISSMSPEISSSGPFVAGHMQNESIAYSSSSNMWSANGELTTGEDSVTDVAYYDAAHGASTLINMATTRNYPLNHLSGRAIKDTIVSHIVSPVVARGGEVCAFRIVWRVGTALLDEAWRRIAQKRQLSDAVVRQDAGVHLFVSSVTGVFTKPTAQDTKSTSVFPAISYWVVSDKDDNCSHRVFPQLHKLFPDSEVKRISARQNDGDNIRAPLFVVLKDHNSGYVRQRIESSVLELGMADTPDILTPAKMVIIARSLHACIPRDVQQIFSSVSLFLHVEHASMDDDMHGVIASNT